MSGSLSTSPAATQPGLIDHLADSFLDLSEFDSVPYQSPSLSPVSSNKTTFTTRSIKTETAQTSLLSTSQPLTGPSHQYDLYKQQTGIVPGALATTLAANQNNSHIHGFGGLGGFDYLGMANSDDVFDFNDFSASPDMDLEFDSPSSNPSMLFESTVNPSSIGGQEPSTLSSPSPLSTQSNVGRMWPGMHQQAALARAQQQQQQQQQQLLQRQRRTQQHSKQASKSKSPQATDPIVEQKITQLLNSMRAKPSTAESSQNPPVINLPRPRKDEDEMDEDERLLASEEGKKLSSKERRQLRNKVSARAFRSRRKEYISQLETEIANKVNENGDLRAQNRALIEENKRLSDLTRMLLSSPSFSDFLDRLSSNPQMIPQAQPQSQDQRQMPKDVNPYAAQQVTQHPQIGLAMIPEQTAPMMAINPVDGFSFQPQVYAVLETPEPILDAATLSGKPDSFASESFDSSDEDKAELPMIEHPAPAPPHDVAAAAATTPAPIDEQFENDPDFALYHDSPSTPEAIKPAVELDIEALSQIDIFGGIEPEKAFARYELVDATEEEAAACLAMARFQRINANLESVAARLELLTIGL
jgi:hypothetical protein